MAIFFLNYRNLIFFIYQKLQNSPKGIKYAIQNYSMLMSSVKLASPIFLFLL